MFEIDSGELRATFLGNQSDWKPTHETTYQHTRRRCDGRRMVRRARASFEIDHSESSASRVAISRTAGPDGAQKTSGATSTNTPLERREGRAAADTTARGRTRYGAQHPLRGTTPVTRHHTPHEAPHPLRGTTPVTGHDTRSEEVHCLRIGCTPNHKNKRGICETTTDTTRRPLHPLRGTTPDQKRCTAYRSGAHPITRTNAESARQPPTQQREGAPVMSRCTRYGALHPLRGATPVTGRDTRSEGVHCLQIGCAPNHKNKRGICEMTTDTHQAPGARSVNCAPKLGRV